MSPSPDEMLALLNRETSMVVGAIAPFDGAARMDADSFALKVGVDTRMEWRRGCGVTVDRGPATHPDTASLFLAGSMTGAIAAQIGLYPFHGSTLEWNGRGVVLTGPSGAGKSTFAAGLAQRGYPLLSDDLTLLFEHRGDPLLVLPWSKPLKLWEDSLALTGLPPGAKISPDYAKFTVTVPRAERSAAPGAVILLEEGPLAFARLSSGEALRVWSQDHYCRTYLATARGWSRADQFADAAEKAAAVPAYRFTAPRDHASSRSFAAALDFVEAALNEILP